MYGTQFSYTFILTTTTATNAAIIIIIIAHAITTGINMVKITSVCTVLYANKQLYGIDLRKIIRLIQLNLGNNYFWRVTN